MVYLMKGIYAILDEGNFNFKKLDIYIHKMIDMKIKFFQIRIKSSITKEKINAIWKIKKLCLEKNCILLINDNIELAKNLDLDGIHIGANDIDIIDARRILGEKKIIGVSCYNNVKLALQAEERNATYVSFGSLYKTKTKEKPVELEIKTVKEAKNVIKIPICVIGGINKDNIHKVIKLNCDLIAISNGLSSIDKIIKISKIYYG